MLNKYLVNVKKKKKKKKNRKPHSFTSRERRGPKITDALSNAVLKV